MCAAMLVLWLGSGHMIVDPFVFKASKKSPKATTNYRRPLEHRH